MDNFIISEKYFEVHKRIMFDIINDKLRDSNKSIIKLYCLDICQLLYCADV